MFSPILWIGFWLPVHTLNFLPNFVLVRRPFLLRSFREGIPLLIADLMFFFEAAFHIRQQLIEFFF